MAIYGFVPHGYEGALVKVEVDIRRGIPGMDIIGLPDGAVREAKDRVRAAVRNSGFEYPAKRILVNLAPAGIRKTGAVFDLAIAVGVILQNGGCAAFPPGDVLVMGELELSGKLRSVPSALAGARAALTAGIKPWILPAADCPAVGRSLSLRPLAISHLRDLRDPSWMDRTVPNEPRAACATQGSSAEPDLREVLGHTKPKRALEIAAAGGHHILLFGPPGTGKTMLARRFSGILPDLAPEASLEVGTVWSLAGLTPPGRRPPFRSPHHSASAESLVGGGQNGIMPGEASLAHHGVLLLDEVHQFSTSTLAQLKEPLVDRNVSISRVGEKRWFPAHFQLIMTANPCPCGNLGRGEAVCGCRRGEVQRYWARLGGALLDRIDLRIPVDSSGFLTRTSCGGSQESRQRVVAARERARSRNAGNSLNTGANVEDLLSSLAPSARLRLAAAVQANGYSARGIQGIVAVARTVADLEGQDGVGEVHIQEALALRKYGDADYHWPLSR